jgi:phage terminase small subunit
LNRARLARFNVRVSCRHGLEALQRGTIEPAGHYDKLAEDERRFVDEYLIDLNAWDAYERAGLKGNVDRSLWKLLASPRIQNAIREQRTLLDGDRPYAGARFVLGKLWDIATADPRNLVEIHNVPCRYCHGIEGSYQYTQTEIKRLRRAYILGQQGKPVEVLWPRGPAEDAAWHAGAAGIEFDMADGGVYMLGRPPNPACQECGGAGKSVTYLHDTRTLNRASRALFKGVKFSRNGQYEIAMANQEAALDMLSRHYGVAVERRELVVRTIDPSALSEEELTHAITALEQMVIDGEYKVIDGANGHSGNDHSGNGHDGHSGNDPNSLSHLSGYRRFKLNGRDPNISSLTDRRGKVNNPWARQEVVPVAEDQPAPKYVDTSTTGVVKRLDDGRIVRTRQDGQVDGRTTSPCRRARIVPRPLPPKLTRPQ